MAPVDGGPGLGSLPVPRKGKAASVYNTGGHAALVGDLVPDVEGRATIASVCVAVCKLFLILL